MAIGKFWESMGMYGNVWECMGKYGRRHPPTPEATEDKPATHTQCRSSKAAILSYYLILSHTLPYFPIKAAICPTALSGLMILILPGSHSGVTAEKSAEIPHIAKAQLIGDFFQWQTGFFKQSSGFQHL